VGNDQRVVAFVPQFQHVTDALILRFIGSHDEVQKYLRML